MQQVDNAAAVLGSGKPVMNIKRRLAKENVGSLVLQLEQCPLNAANAGSADIAVGGFVFGSVLTHVLHHATQILKV